MDVHAPPAAGGGTRLPCTTDAERHRTHLMRRLSVNSPAVSLIKRLSLASPRSSFSSLVETAADATSAEASSSAIPAAPPPTTTRALLPAVTPRRRAASMFDTLSGLRIRETPTPGRFARPSFSGGRQRAAASDASAIELVEPSALPAAAAAATPNAAASAAADSDAAASACVAAAAAGTAAPSLGAPSRAHRSLDRTWRHISALLRRYRVEVSMWVFLTLLGLGASCVSFGVDLTVRALKDVRVFFASSNPGATRTNAERAAEAIIAQFGRAPWVAQYAIWVASCGALAAGATALTAYVAPVAAGSGIPEMYSLMSAYTSRQNHYTLGGFLSMRVLLVKAVGVVLAIGSGLPIGREGPYVAMCACACALMQRLPVFGLFRTSPQLRQQMLSAACALGVSTALGAPLGGVLFSIEVTSSYYHVSHYWKGFFVALVGALWSQNLMRIDNKSTYFHALFTTYFGSTIMYRWWEIPIFILLGLCCGVLGGLWVRSVAFVRRTTKLLYERWFKNTLGKGLGFKSAKVQIVLTLCAALTIAAVEFPLGLPGCTHKSHSTQTKHVSNAKSTSAAAAVLAPPLSSSNAAIDTTLGGVSILAAPLKWVVHDLFTDSKLDDALALHCTTFARFGYYGGIKSTLVMYFIAKWIASCICATLLLPRGLFLPIFALGAVFGRLAAQTLTDWGGASTIVGGGYAVVGAASMVAAATGSISVAIIAFEITAQLSNMIPVLLAVLVASHVGRIVSKSAYQDLANQSKLKNDPMLQPVALFKRVAKDAMRPIAGAPERPRLGLLSRQRQLLKKGGADALLVHHLERGEVVPHVQQHDAEEDRGLLTSPPMPPLSPARRAHSRRYSSANGMQRSVPAMRVRDDSRSATVVPRFVTRTKLAALVAEAGLYDENKVAVVEDVHGFLFQGAAQLADLCTLLQDGQLWERVEAGASRSPRPPPPRRAAPAIPKEEEGEKEGGVDEGVVSVAAAVGLGPTLMLGDVAIDIVVDGGVALEQYSAHVPSTLPLSDLCFFFAAHHVSRTYVVEDQVLVGVVDLVDLDRVTKRSSLR